MDRIETQLRRYYEEEAARSLRPDHSGPRVAICHEFAAELAASGRSTVLDVGCGPAVDHAGFDEQGVRYVGVDLAIGNAVLAARADRMVLPATLFHLPFADAAFPAGWSMSTFQHVPDDRIHEALDEFVRVLQSGAPVTIGLWGGRDEVVEPTRSSTGVALARHFTLRSHDRIRSMLGEHLVLDASETFPDEVSGWEYHVARGQTPR